MLRVSDFGRKIVDRMRHEGFAGRNVQVVDFVEKHTHGCKESYMSTLQNAKIVIKVNGKEETHILFIKRACWDSDFTKKMLIHGTVYKKEVEAYDSVFPFMAKFQSEKDATMESISSYIPRCYLSCGDEENSYIVMEDIKSQGFKIGDIYDGFSFDECHLVLQKVAKIHAVGYAIRVTNPDISLKNMFPNVLQENTYSESDPINLKYECTLCYRAATKMVSMFNLDLALKMNKFNNKIFETVCQPYVCSGDPLEVICLGDLWLNNIMIKYDDEGRPIDIRFLDFQMLRAASLTLELNYFFYTSTTAKLRKSSYLHLLGVYLNSFRRTLTKLGVVVPEYLTLEFLEEKMRQQLSSILLLMPLITSLQWSESIREDSTVLEDLFASEFFNYWEGIKLDENYLEKIALYKGLCKAIYSKRIRERLLDFYSEIAEKNIFD